MFDSVFTLWRLIACLCCNLTCVAADEGSKLLRRSLLSFASGQWAADHFVSKILAMPAARYDHRRKAAEKQALDIIGCAFHNLSSAWQF